MYLGQLFLMEDYRAFGLFSNTHNKTIVICDNMLTETSIMKDVMSSLSTAFVNAIQNPFQPVGNPLVMNSLDGIISNIIQKHNSINLRKKV